MNGASTTRELLNLIRQHGWMHVTRGDPSSEDIVTVRDHLGQHPGIYRTGSASSSETHYSKAAT